MGCKDLAKLKMRRRKQRREKGHRREAVIIKRKMKKLQTLIPGGRKMKPDQLYLRTAQHILKLRLQVNLLQALSKLMFKP
ncbi:hypothetical protein RIF29_36247 [Crotalaria pallida]|uniref:Uncharacterized protein n=1 Tax=Crotalaria pallida TaxID=3830 RepID=A0AAN9EHA9_CROPI